MFFLIRMAFWIGLVLMLLPLSTAEDGTRQIGAWQALSAAQSALSDASGFCQRQPDACAVGGQLLGHLGDKAQAGIKWLFENVGTKQDAANVAASVLDKLPGGHALTPQDLVPAWGGEVSEMPKPALLPANGVPFPPRKPV